MALYLTHCDAFARSPVIVTPSFQNPPVQAQSPTIYCQDVMLRLDEVKAAITSTFGRVLKMDSTKKIVRKLAGHGTGTATWATNVGNEHGQVLVSILTASEGHGLDAMVTGLMRRYTVAEVPPPELLYVDKDCCGNSFIRRLFAAWPEMQIRLDIWHFMRRFSAGCSTDAHPLYGTFMSRLSQCIFRWSAEDLDNLRDAKRSKLARQDVEAPTAAAVSHTLTRKELATHCQRETRGTVETTRLIQELLAAFDGDGGRDSLGVPLLDSAKMWDIWEKERRHVGCIQDPSDISLYTRTGTSVKGGVTIPVYRCARGSTSLESFHLHLNRFVPGKDIHEHRDRQRGGWVGVKFVC